VERLTRLDPQTIDYLSFAKTEPAVLSKTVVQREP